LVKLGRSLTAIDVARRFELDVGKHLLEKAATATVAMARLKQMRSYIAETVAASFRKLKDQGRTLTAGRVARVVQDALLASQNLPAGVENLYRYHRLKLARDLDEFEKFARRRAEFLKGVYDPRTKLPP
jgi:DNA-binding Lrp family transcriptional regulator